MEKEQLDRKVEEVMQRLELDEWHREEVRESMRKMDREIAEHRAEHLRFMKRSRFIFRLLMVLIGLLTLSAIFTVLFPSIKQICLYVSSASCFAVSIINYKQFLDALSWDKRWAAVLLFVAILNIFNGARLLF